MWQNLGYDKMNRCIRIFFVSIISFLLILSTTFVVLGQNFVNKQIEKISPQVECVQEDPSPYTYEAALADSRSGSTSLGILYCYCKQVVIESTNLSLWNIVKSDSKLKQQLGENEFCKSFVLRYLVQNLLILLVPLAIVFLTWVSKTILRTITTFERAQN